MERQLRFQDKVVVVTGAAQGIGEAYAEGTGRRGRTGRRRRHQRRCRPAGRQGHRGERRHRDVRAVRRLVVGLGRGAGGHGRGRVGRHRRPDQQRRHLRRHAVRPADLGRLGLLPQVHEREHGRRAGDDPGDLPVHAGAGRRRHRQPVQHRRLPLLRLLRTGQGRHQLTDAAARARARRHEHPRQRDRSGPDRHRGDPGPGRRRGHGDGQVPRAEADGSARGHGGRRPVPVVRRVAWITGQILAVDGGQTFRS